ncbi:MAG: Rieske 2Fe-2S domain-containing protein [Nitrosopumilus sp.]|nr:Rieske 2Fe-2S domain-containing protein [Nitrosopumilus sp.]CAI9830995.1 Rieske (2Fe-2S) domain-containing protein [Nitrosopumilaceae archaeon]MDA7943841.1 Rieske 2Fe-2S domain-containing protein [Nitrosopumilus sp.]MDA7944981.1 Rieske 2Fe-2S domain-containing protein [Nitrosopumilus sp.]MDA7953234.1 Rieske 2Fe-2S domain-containing protein [Nitrosopumilus sp.]
MRVRVCGAGDVPPGTMAGFRAGGRDLLVLNEGGRYHVVDDTCTHSGASLAAGALDGCTVRCGWHGAEFDCTTGRLSRFPARIPDLGSYPASEDAGGVFADLPDL